MFVCHGNICRSPMAELIFKNMLREQKLEDQFIVNSSATSDEEINGNIGNPVYPPAKQELQKHGISASGKYATQLQNSDYDRYDFFIGMDRANVRNMHRIFGGDPQSKIHRLMEYTNHPDDVADPWYTNRFDITYRDIFEGCTALLTSLRKQHNVIQQ